MADAWKLPGVVGATVNVLCELARKSPEDYLPLAPQLFHLLTTSSNNWMLIKIIKLVSSRDACSVIPMSQSTYSSDHFVRMNLV